MFLGRVSSILNSNLESDRLLRPFSLRFSLPSNRPVNFILLFNQERDYESFIIVFFLRYLSNSGRTKTIYNTTRWHNVPGGGGGLCVRDSANRTTTAAKLRPRVSNLLGSLVTARFNESSWLSAAGPTKNRPVYRRTRTFHRTEFSIGMAVEN